MGVGCAWLFLAVPGVFGIVVLLSNGGRSAAGWALTSVFLVGTGYLLFLFVNADRIGVRRVGKYDDR